MTDEVNPTAEGSDTTDSGTPTPAEAASAATPSTPTPSGLPTELRGRLLGLGLTDGHVGRLESEGVTSADDMARLNADQIKALTGCGLVTAMKVAEAFVPAPVAADVAAAPERTASFDMLPAVPDDSSFIEMLKVGGVLKISQVDVISAMRAALASEVGLYALPDVLMDRMERFANEQEEPVGENFYRLQRLLTERRYGDVLSALGATGTFVSDRRKKDTLARLNADLWPALHGFNNQLKSWSEAWATGMANPGMALAALAMANTGTKGMLPPGMLQPPDTAGLRDESEAVINRINKVFAGTGFPVARALAYDATRIKGVLEDPTLPAAVGAATKDQMLKMLGVNVGPDYVRLERNLVRFALAIMELPKVSSGNEEYGYLGAMLQLGMAIPWDKLGTGASTVVTNGRKRTPASGYETEEAAATAGGFRTEREKLRY